MATRGPKSGGPEDPTQKPRDIPGRSAWERERQMHEDTISRLNDPSDIARLQQRIDHINSILGVASGPSFNKLDSLLSKLNTSQPSNPTGESRAPSSYSGRKWAELGELAAQWGKSSPKSQPSSSFSKSSPSNLHLYSGGPERLADVSEKAAIASRAAAYVRANRYSRKVLEQARGLSDQLKGTQFENVGKQALSAASGAYNASENAMRESRESKYAHKIAKFTGLEKDIEFAKGKTLSANKARDLHEQATNFAARYFRDIAQKGLEATSNSLKNPGAGWYSNWLKHQTGGIGSGGGSPGQGRGGSGGRGNIPPVNPPGIPPSGGQRGRRTNHWGRARRRLRKARQRRMTQASNIASKTAKQTAQRGMQVGRARRRLRKARRSRALRQASAASRAKQIQQIKTFAKIGIASSAIHQAASGNLLGAARTMAWGSGNPVAIIGTELTNAALTATKALSQMSEQTFETNKYLANYSGTLAYAYGSFNVGEYRRQFQFAGGTGESGARLVESMDRMRDSWLKYNIAERNITNTISSFFTRASSGVGASFSGAIGGFGDFVGGLGAKKIPFTGKTVDETVESTSKFLTDRALELLLGGGDAARGAVAMSMWKKVFGIGEPPIDKDLPMVDFLKGMVIRDRADLEKKLTGHLRPPPSHKRPR